jgi:type IV secretory pathway TraG/TraD family ATPase VirD4
MSFVKAIEEFDSKHGIPRPSDSQHLPAFHAFLRITQHVGLILVLLTCGSVSAYLLWLSAQYLGVSSQTQLFFVIGMLLCLFVAFMEATHEVMPYYRIKQRLTYGTGRWADEIYLKNTGLALKVGDDLSGLPRGAVRVAKLRKGYDLVLPETEWLRHLAVFGPPGSGKSKTFLMSMLRDISRGGSAIVLDPKGELFEQTAGSFRQVYRLDLLNPSRSDRWNFVPQCKDDHEFASQMAATMIGLEGTKHSFADPFWQESSLLLLTTVLLHLSDVVDNPTPPMVFEYLGMRDMKTIDTEMSNTMNQAVRLSWGAFKKAPPQTQGSVITSLMNKLAPFEIKNAQAVCAPITEGDRLAGVKQIDFTRLRTPGTAIYVIVAEGDATRYENVLSTFFGQAVNQLRIDRREHDVAPVTFCLDEAANVPLVGLKEIAGVGRGRKIGLILGYQNLPQVQDQYNHDGANAILGSIGTMIFLPGLDDATSQFASRRIGQTTVWSHTTIDARGRKMDSERQSETGRALMDPTELRQMVKHTQCVVVIDSAPPIKASYPPFGLQKVRALAPEYGSPRLVSLLQAEEEKLEKTAREFREQELAAAAAQMNSGVLEEELAIEGTGSVATAMMDSAVGDRAAVVEDGVYQAVFQRMVDGKLPEPSSLATQSPFAKLLKCYYDTGRITKWEDVRELDIKVMKRVGVTNRATSAGTVARAVVQDTASPVSAGAIAPSVSLDGVGVVQSVNENAVAACEQQGGTVDGDKDKSNQRSFVFFTDQGVQKELMKTASVIITNRARSDGKRPEVKPAPSYRGVSPAKLSDDVILNSRRADPVQDALR